MLKSNEKLKFVSCDETSLVVFGSLCYENVYLGPTLLEHMFQKVPHFVCKLLRQQERSQVTGDFSFRILAFRWILASSKSKKGKPISEVLSQELINAAANEGEAVTKKENMHKMAESNKAFAHLAW